jgi:hypothetical protein
MPVIGFNFTKLSIEKKGTIDVKERVSNSLKITEIKKETTEKTERAVGRFSFEFKIDYGKAGNAELFGDLIFGDTSKNLDAWIAEFKKSKAIPTELKITVYNTILYRCNIKGLSLAQELGLPPHFEMPRIQKED